MEHLRDGFKFHSNSFSLVLFACKKWSGICLNSVLFRAVVFSIVDTVSKLNSVSSACFSDAVLAERFPRAFALHTQDEHTGVLP